MRTTAENQTDDDFPGVNFGAWGHDSQTPNEVTPSIFKWKRYSVFDADHGIGFENAVKLIEDRDQ